MLTKLCRCGAMIPATESQCAKCKAKYQINYDKYYRKNYDVYHSRQWAKLRKYVLVLFQYVDVYAYYKYGRIVPACTVHHIVEVSEDISKAYDVENLIPVSDRSHREIHQRYRQEDKLAVQRELVSYMKDFKGRG